MLVVGVVGGIASGKSLVAEQFRQMGAAVLDADGAGHEVLQDAAVKDCLVERFGVEILQPKTQEIDRSKLAALVFAPPPAGPANLSYLELQTHPRIKEKLKEQISRLADQGIPVAILDAAVMLKAGWESVCNYIIFVHTPVDVRESRALTRGWTVEQFRAREQAQLPLDAKRSECDFEIDNSQSIQQTLEQVTQIWNYLNAKEA